MAIASCVEDYTYAPLTSSIMPVGLTSGRSQAYDSHCNIVLGNVEETITLVDESQTVRVSRTTTPHRAKRPTLTCHTQTVTKQSEMMFVRGDSVTIICMGNKR